AIAAALLHLLEDRCGGDDAKPAAAILLGDEAGEEAALGQRADELGWVGPVAIECAPIFTRKAGAERGNGLADLCDVGGGCHGHDLGGTALKLLQLRGRRQSLAQQAKPERQRRGCVSRSEPCAQPSARPITPPCARIPSWPRPPLMFWWKPSWIGASI